MRSLLLQIKYDCRQGILCQWKRYILLIAVYIVCVAQFIWICERSRYVDTYTSADMVLWMFKRIEKYVPDTHKLVDISAPYILPNIIIAYIIGNYIIKDLYGYGKNLMVRTGSRVNWWISKCIWCVITVFISYALMYAVILAASVVTHSLSLNITPDVCVSIMGMDKVLILNYANLDYMLSSVMLSSVLMSIALSVFQILVTLLISPVIAYMAVMIMIVLAAFVDNPLVITLYCMVIRSRAYMPQGYGVSLAIVIMLIIITACAVAGGLYANNMDIVSKREEWQNLDD